MRRVDTASNGSLRWALVACATAGLALTGCPSPNVYGTARTLRPGTIQHTVGLDTIGVSTSGASIFTPTLPTYQLRLGVADRVDLGIRLANLSSVGADAKINLVRGAFDLAVMPGLQGIYLSTGGSSTTASGSMTSSSSSTGILYMHLPVLLGFNLSRSFSLMASPGIMYAVSFSNVSSGSDSAKYNATGFAVRLGLGVNIRVTEGFAIHPEFTALYFPDSGGVLHTPSLGFTFGAHPDYSDIQ